MPQMPKDTDLHIGRRLFAFREASGLTLEEVAAKTGCSTGKLEQLEAGDLRVTASELWMLCGVFGKRPSDFFEGLEAYPVTPSETRSRNPE